MYASNTAEVMEPCTNDAPQETFVVMLMTGNSDGGRRATLAFTAATCAAAMNKRTVLFLAGDGAHWAYEGRTGGVRQNGFPALDDLMESLVDMGGEIYVCSACDQVCSVAGNEAAGMARHPAVQPRGMSAVLSDISAGRSVTF